MQNYVKVKILWEGHKNLKKSPSCFDVYLVNQLIYQNKREIYSNFCGLFRKVELYVSTGWILQKRFHLFVVCWKHQRQILISIYHSLLYKTPQGLELLSTVIPKLNTQSCIKHTMLRRDATPKKRWLGFDFKFQKFSIKQVFFIDEICSSRIKAPCFFMFF